MSKIFASTIASFLGKRLIGRDFEIKGVCSIKSFKSNTVCFITSLVSLEQAPLDLLILTTDQWVGAGRDVRSYVSVINPREAYAKVVEHFFNIRRHSISASAVIGKNVVMGEGVFVGDYVVIEDNSIIGDNTSIDHGSMIGRGTEIGSNCHIGAGVIIGNEGLNSFLDSSGKLKNIRHLGHVVIQDYVEVGAASTIARGTIDETIIGENTHIGPQVNIGHNSTIGINCVIAGRAHVSGSCIIGENCRLWANCTISDYVRVGDNAVVGMGALVKHDVPAGETFCSLSAISLKRLARFVYTTGWGK